MVNMNDLEYLVEGIIDKSTLERIS